MVMVKICGVRTVADARACRRAGADLAGLNFVPTSRRHVDPASAERLIDELGHVAAVGVFQDVAAPRVGEVVAELGLRWIQVHGEVRAREFERLSESVCIIRACPAHEASAEALLPWTELGATPLLDGPSPGSGQRFGWHELHAPATRFFVAGGLDANNVAEAIRLTGASGVDAATGVERDGRIAPDLVSKFVLAARRSSEYVR
jgi:phosphoribosylanthranilate isomerase